MIKVVRPFLRFSTLNEGEMSQFNKISNWWDPSGPMQMLYQYNYHRVKFLVKHAGKQGEIKRPLEGLNILDVGCGAGFLTKSLARLGANVVGVDPNATSFEQAKRHQELYSDQLQHLSYKNMTLEQYLQAQNTANSFDVVTSMDVIQHVDNPSSFLNSISKAAKEGGTVIVSTIARRPQTWLTHILLAEYVTRVVPQNTHHYEKFINPEELEGMMAQAGVDRKARLQLGISWRGELVEEAGGGNFISLGHKRASVVQ